MPLEIPRRFYGTVLASEYCGPPHPVPLPKERENHLAAPTTSHHPVKEYDLAKSVRGRALRGRVRHRQFLMLFTYWGLGWLCLGASGGIIGTNVPAEAVTAERISQLPKREQGAWREYLKRSLAQRRADQDFFRREMKTHGVTQSTLPREQRGVRGIPLDRPREWHGSDEARRLADNLVSFQTPAGGWSKNIDMTSQPRAPGERFANGNLSRYPGGLDFDTPHDADWKYVGTFDNDATTTQLQFLARVITASGGASDSHRKAFLKGLDYIFAAQYPNGGWPQVWPFQGGYHDAITYNDGAITHILALLKAVASNEQDYGFVPRRTRMRARRSMERGIECVLATQIRVDGRRTVWCQQHDTLTLAPTSARNYEMPCQASAESAEIALFLMDLPKPAVEIISAVDSAVKWFEKTKIENVDYRRGDPNGRDLVAAQGQGPLWARYYEIGTDRPIFGDRDQTIHDRLEEISAERRRGYGWYRDTPREAIVRYRVWKTAEGRVK